MIFESRINRQQWISIALSFVPIFLIAYVLTLLFGEFRGSFLIAFIAVFGLSTGLWLTGAILQWIYFFAHGRKSMARAMADTLLSRKYPKPEEYQQSSISYYESIATNSTLDLDTRMRAVGDLATVNAFRLMKNSSFAWQLEIASEDAVEMHRRKLDEIEAIAAERSGN